MIKAYKEIHQQGNISVEKELKRGLIKGDFGIQISSDGRVWICIDSIATIRFKPAINLKERRSKEMKCVKKDFSQIIKVTNKRAEYLVYKQGYKYCPKKQFKRQGKED